jgi:hypothetical protein
MVHFVEVFNKGKTMATVNFSVPDDVKQAFNDAFEGQNKSAIVADLMREAVARAQAKARSQAAIERILKRRSSMPALSRAALRKARETGRP